MSLAHTHRFPRLYGRGNLCEHIYKHLISSREVTMLKISQQQPPFHASSIATRLCTHSRMIGDVLTPQGLKSGQVRCLECGAVFDDPDACVQEED